ncbi:hypothetical protein WDU94_006498 [Cyamophila willieti]
MSLRTGSVYVLPGGTQGGSNNPGGNMTPTGQMGPPIVPNQPQVAIVAPQKIIPPPTPPQKSSSLDYLNFEEKRKIIASSLSLTDFLHHNNTSGSSTTPASPTQGRFECFEQRVFILCLCVNVLFFWCMKSILIFLLIQCLVLLLFVYLFLFFDNFFCTQETRSLMVYCPY